MLLRMLLFAGLAAAGHEIGTTRVTAEFTPAGAYTVTIVTDAAALAEKLGVEAGALSDKAEALRGRMELLFDGVAARSEISVGVAEDAATILLAGELPENARAFQWKWGWTFTSYSLAVAGGEPVWLEGGERSAPLAVQVSQARANGWEVARRYVALGFTHIIPLGLDHVLFVLGLYLLNSRPRAVLVQVTAFTVAHSITLGLTMQGWVAVSPRIVEPMIAISIAYVAIENLFLRELRAWRVALVFGFGLLHGMGFAGVLAELGMPEGQMLMALASFNAGVEAGQMAVVGGAFLLVGWQCAERTWYRGRVAVPASLAIACAAVYWTIERVWG